MHVEAEARLNRDNYCGGARGLGMLLLRHTEPALLPDTARRIWHMPGEDDTRAHGDGSGCAGTGKMS